MFIVEYTYGNSTYDKKFSTLLEAQDFMNNLPLIKKSDYSINMLKSASILEKNIYMDRFI